MDGITEESKPELQNLKGQICEIQVCSILAHCWNEIEHDLVYKPKQGEIPQEEKELLKVLGTLSTVGDTVIQQLKQSVNQRIKAHTGEFENLLDFIVRLKDKFPEATNFEKDPSQLYDELMRLELDSPEKLTLEELLTPPTPADITEFNGFLHGQQGLDYSLDPLTSDVLLFNLLEKKAADTVQHYLGPGKIGRPLRIVSLAKSYQQFRGQRNTNNGDE